MKYLFHSLFALAVNEDASVDDYCEHVSRSCVCSPIFVQGAFVVGDTFVSFLSLA